MTTIGSTHYSIYSSLNRTSTSAQGSTDALSGGSATSSGSVSSSRLSGGTASGDDTAAAKLSDVLWQLTSTSDESAADDDVWQDGGDTSSLAEKAFLDLADMTLGERIRAQYLEDNDLTEKDLAKMTDEERAKIEDKITQAIEQAVEQQTGGVAGTKMGETAA